MAMGTTGASSLLSRTDDVDKTSTASLQEAAPIPTPQPMAPKGPTPGDISVARRADSSATTGLGASGSTRQIGRGGYAARTINDNPLLSGPGGAFKEDPAKLGSLIQDPNDPRRQPVNNPSVISDPNRQNNPGFDNVGGF